MKEWEKNIVNLTLKGIPLYNSFDANDIGVGMYETNRIVYNEDGSYSSIKEWTLDTQGINLVDIMSFDEVDKKRTVSNDFYEAYEIFGILGVRNLLIKEINDVLSGEGVTYRHLTMLADTMTYKGHMMPISRHGINRSADYGPIGKSSFEEMTDMLLKSATYAEVDNMQGSSANVMMGQFVKAGTNAFNLKLDEEVLLSKGTGEVREESDGDYGDESDDGDESGDESDEDDGAPMAGHEIEAEIDDMYEAENKEFDAHHSDFGLSLDLNQQHKLGVVDNNITVKVAGKNVVMNMSGTDDSDDSSEEDESSEEEESVGEKESKKEEDGEENRESESEEDLEDIEDESSEEESEEEVEKEEKKKAKVVAKKKPATVAKKVVMKKTATTKKPPLAKKPATAKKVVIKKKK